MPDSTDTNIILWFSDLTAICLSQDMIQCIGVSRTGCNQAFKKILYCFLWKWSQNIPQVWLL